jgi:hypothetical protein
MPHRIFFQGDGMSVTFYPTKLYCCQICTKKIEDLVDKTALIKSLKEPG